MPISTPSSRPSKRRAEVLLGTTPPFVYQYPCLVKLCVIGPFSRVCARVLFVWNENTVAL